MGCDVIDRVPRCRGARRLVDAYPGPSSSTDVHDTGSDVDWRGPVHLPDTWPDHTVASMQIVYRSVRMNSGRGYFGVVAYSPRHDTNIGTLWRSASTYDAAFIATIGARYIRQPGDTPKTPLHTPLWSFDTFDDFIGSMPTECKLIAVELATNSIPLPDFDHPERAVYLLGAEDTGIPAGILDQCDDVVQIPTPARWSLNVAVAGSITLASRYEQTLGKKTVMV